MENNGVLKKLSPSTVNSDFCDKLEEYYMNFHSVFIAQNKEKRGLS